MSNARNGGGTHGKRGTDLFSLRERILVQERIVARCEARVAKWTAYPSSIPQLLSEAKADLKETSEKLADLRRELAESAREVMS